MIVNVRNNAATDTAALIIPAVGNNKLRHETLQRFMLANDSVTVAVEVPIWLQENDIAAIEARWGIALLPNVAGQERPITGHIDFVQVRNGAIHILDYKPDATTNRPFAQLTIYALALSHLDRHLHCSISNARGSTSTSIANFFRARSSHAAIKYNRKRERLDSLRNKWPCTRSAGDGSTEPYFRFAQYLFCEHADFATATCCKSTNMIY